jgi:hypothetical protein
VTALFFKQTRAVGFNHVPVPVKTLLPITVICAAAVIIAVDIHKSIAFGHLFGTLRNKIDAAPAGIAEKLHPVFLDRVIHLPEMIPVIVDMGITKRGKYTFPKIPAFETKVFEVLLRQLAK